MSTKSSFDLATPKMSGFITALGATATAYDTFKLAKDVAFNPAAFALCAVVGGIFSAAAHSFINNSEEFTKEEHQVSRNAINAAASLLSGILPSWLVKFPLSIGSLFWNVIGNSYIGGLRFGFMATHTYFHGRDIYPLIFTSARSS